MRVTTCANHCVIESHKSNRRLGPYYKLHTAVDDSNVANLPESAGTQIIVKVVEVLVGTKF